MIFITARFTVREEYQDDWPAITRTFTEATRAEPGCLWFTWSRSIENPQEYVLVEAFRDAAAGAEHVHSEHFRRAQRELPPHLVATPQIVNVEVPGTEWSRLEEMAVEGS